jgi:aryl-alcohol dehydrogenase-like predicted oxidoreductase
MRSSLAQLALGTVQFGLDYGISGRGAAVPEDEVRRILEVAASEGIQQLDTAPAYGNIEERLAELSAGLNFRITSKIPALPDGLGPESASRFVLESAFRSRRRLGTALKSLLLHNGDDLLGPAGDALWGELAAFASGEGVRLGVSCYDTATLSRVCKRFPITAAQISANAFDQRLHGEPWACLRDVELHVRSVFLQGLLLMDTETAARRVPASAAQMERWERWLARRGLDPLTAAVGIAKGFSNAAFCVVGVDSESHLKAVIAAWRSTGPLQAPELATGDPTIIDPRTWDTDA